MPASDSSPIVARSIPRSAIQTESVAPESASGTVVDFSSGVFERKISGTRPHEVESALAAINTAHNHVSSDISLAQASADQKIVQSRRAVEIETLKAQAEVEPLRALARQLSELKASGGDARRDPAP